MTNTPIPSHYLYITFLISTLYFVCNLAAKSEDEKIKIARLVNFTLLSSFYTELMDQLSPEQIEKLQSLLNDDLTFRKLNEFFSTNLGEEVLANFSLDALELEFRAAVKAALESLKGDAREQFKKELFKEYDKYRLTDI